MKKFAVLLDLDGVISDTASLHAKAWKTVFDQVFTATGRKNKVFDKAGDYERFIDGKSRQSGIIDFLNSCSIRLPLGESNSFGLDSVYGIGNTKNAVFVELIKRNGIRLFPDAIRLIARLKSEKYEIGLSSSSKNARLVLQKAGILGSFNSIMDGLVAEEMGVSSKPHPDFYKQAAILVGRDPSQCIVVEDAISGVISAKKAGAGKVIGISRGNSRQSLLENGADLVVSSLDELDQVSPFNQKN